jgi:hypothetical protein
VDSAVNRYPGKKSYNRFSRKWGKEQSAHTPDERCQKPIKKETFTAHSLIAKARVDLRVKSVEKSACDQIRWPNYNRGTHHRSATIRDERRHALIEGGETRKRLATPPIENPMSWVDITRSHW